MRGITLQAPGGLDALAIRETSDPGPPGPGEVRVRVRASSLNYHDWRVCSTVQNPAFYGIVPMADGAGVVEAVGEGVREFVVGDMVISVFLPMWQEGRPRMDHMKVIPGDTVDGYACEYVVRPADWFTRAPAGWSAVEAATLPTAGVTAWRALIEDGALRAGATVLTLGTGGVSLFALQFAKALGAKVVITSSSDEKLERARAFGADHTINYRTTTDWATEVVSLTGGRGADHVLEMGGADTLEQSVLAARDGGHIALIGALTGHAVQAPIGLVMRKHVNLQGVVVGSRMHQQSMVDAIEALGLRPVVDKVFGLDELADAFRFEKAGRHFGKVCVQW